MGSRQFIFSTNQSAMSLLILWVSKLSTHKEGVTLMVVNATVNNITVISCRSVILVEETGVPGENHRPAIHTKSFCPICQYL